MLKNRVPPISADDRRHHWPTCQIEKLAKVRALALSLDFKTDTRQRSEPITGGAEPRRKKKKKKEEEQRNGTGKKREKRTISQWIEANLEDWSSSARAIRARATDRLVWLSDYEGAFATCGPLRLSGELNPARHSLSGPVLLFFSRSLFFSPPHRETETCRASNSTPDRSILLLLRVAML